MSLATGPQPAKVRDDRAPLKPPSRPRTTKGAAILAGWAAIQVARGNLSPDEAKCINESLKLFLAASELADGGKQLAEARALVAQLAREKRLPGPPGAP